MAAVMAAAVAAAAVAAAPVAPPDAAPVRAGARHFRRQVNDRDEHAREPRHDYYVRGAMRPIACIRGPAPELVRSLGATFRMLLLSRRAAEIGVGAAST